MPAGARSAAPDDPAARERYEATRARFERAHGRIVDGHWSTPRGRRRRASAAGTCSSGACNGRCTAAWAASPQRRPGVRAAAGAHAPASPPAPAASCRARAQRLAVARLFTLQPQRHGGARGMTELAAARAPPRPAGEPDAHQRRVGVVRRPRPRALRVRASIAHRRARASATRPPARRSRPSTARSSTSYWSEREPAGVALCCKRVRFGRPAVVAAPRDGEPRGRPPGVLAACCATPRASPCAPATPARDDASGSRSRTSSR